MRQTAHRPLPALVAIVLLVGVMILASIALDHLGTQQATLSTSADAPSVEASE